MGGQLKEADMRGAPIALSNSRKIGAGRAAPINRKRLRKSHSRKGRATAIPNRRAFGAIVSAGGRIKKGSAPAGCRCHLLPSPLLMQEICREGDGQDNC